VCLRCRPQTRAAQRLPAALEARSAGYRYGSDGDGSGSSCAHHKRGEAGWLLTCSEQDGGSRHDSSLCYRLMPCCVLQLSLGSDNDFLGMLAR
jgi:hypothetical protein